MRRILPFLLSILVLTPWGTPAAAQTADTDLNDSASTSSTDTAGTAPAQRHHRFLAQLGLTDAQKAQIKQIVQSTTDRKERRQEIKAILTPEQKMQLKKLMLERRAQRQTNTQ